MKPGYKLKDFARITNLSRKALLLYEKKGILIPEFIDENTGYRYYSRNQLRKAALLALLRSLEIPLVDVFKIVEDRITLKQYITASSKRLELLRQQIRIAHALQMIQICEYNERFTCNQVGIDVIPEMSVISLEGRGTTKDISLYFSLLSRFMNQWHIRAGGPSFTFYFRDSNIEKLHFKTCFPLENYTPVQHPDIRCEVISPMKVAFLYHFGDYETLYTTYSELKGEIRKQNWRNTGEFVETYLISGDKKYTDSSTFVTTVSGIIE